MGTRRRMRAMWLAGVSGVAVMCVWMAGVERARACSPCTCDENEFHVFGPSFVRGGVPRNVRLFVPGAAAAGPRLESDAGEVLIDVEPAGDAVGSVWVSPRELLEPNTAHTLTASVAWGGYRFTTGEAIDEQAPDVSGVALSEGLARGGLCETNVGGVVSIAEYSDDAAIGDYVPVMIELTSGDEVTTLFVPLEAWLHPFEHVLGRSELSAGPSCFGPSWAPGLTLERAYSARVTVWDWSGNSTTIDGLSFTPTRAEPGGCGDEGITLCSSSPAQGGSSMWGAIVALALALWWRRR